MIRILLFSAAFSASLFAQSPAHAASKKVFKGKSAHTRFNRSRCVGPVGGYFDLPCETEAQIQASRCVSVYGFATCKF